LQKLKEFRLRLFWCFGSVLIEQTRIQFAGDISSFLYLLLIIFASVLICYSQVVGNALIMSTMHRFALSPPSRKAFLLHYCLLLFNVQGSNPYKSTNMAITSQNFRMISLWRSAVFSSADCRNVCSVVLRGFLSNNPYVLRKSK